MAHTRDRAEADEAAAGGAAGSAAVGAADDASLLDGSSTSELVCGAAAGLSMRSTFGVLALMEPPPLPNCSSDVFVLDDAADLVFAACAVC